MFKILSFLRFEIVRWKLASSLVPHQSDAHRDQPVQFAISLEFYLRQKLKSLGNIFFFALEVNIYRKLTPVFLAYSGPNLSDNRYVWVERSVA